MKERISNGRLIGILYLLVIICAGFSQGYVRESLIEWGDAAATMQNIFQSEGLFRIGLIADLIAFLLDAVISVLLYQLLKPFGKTLALISSAFRLLAHPAIAALNLLNHHMALEVVNSGAAEYQESFMMMFLNAHHYGYLLAGAFFGVHCFLLGVLLQRSSLIPKIFGLLMMVAACGYLIETFGNFLLPGNEILFGYIVGISAAIGEVSLTIYLLVKGGKLRI